MVSSVFGLAPFKISISSPFERRIAHVPWPLKQNPSLTCLSSANWVCPVTARVPCLDQGFLTDNPQPIVVLAWFN